MACTMEIMPAAESEAIAQCPQRRCYSPEPKTQVVAHLLLVHGINANIIHRWLREQAA